MKHYRVFIALLCLILLGNAEKYNVIFEGDSLTANDINLSGNFADRTYNELGMQGTYVNHGTSGATMRKDIYLESSQIDALYDADYDKNLIVLWAGTNDLSSSSDDQIERAIADWCNGRKAAGFHVIVSTITPKNGNMETHRQAVNTFIQTHWHEFADGMTDPGNNATLANYNDATYYYDGLHLTDKGATIAAELAKSAILDVIHDNQPKRCPVSGTWSIEFSDSTDKSMNLMLWVSGGSRIMGYGTITNKGAGSSASATGSFNANELILSVKSTESKYDSQKYDECYLDLFMVNCVGSGTYSLKSGGLSLHEGNATAVKQ
jgi:lysophospholipase L1-like esterase